MAAPDSKPSPSNQTVESSKTEENNADEPAPESTNVKPAPTPQVAAVAAVVKEPSYDNSESSDYYVLAKGFLNDGDFEQALTTIEEGIEATRAALSADETATEDSIALHPAMAPFHYLYGTTLLYSIEESSDSPAMAMTTEQNNSDDAEATADDMQIAFENLEAARIILEHMMASEASDKLKLDLAQIYLRGGDLNRMNGRYDAAISDYSSCLRFREGNPLLGPYDRKIADVHYNLALAYSLEVAESKPPEDNPAEAESLEKKLADYRRRSFHHYLVCGKTLCGQIAFLCNQEPAEFLKNAEADIPKFKSTGEDDTTDMDHPKISSMKLQSFRKHVAGLQAPEEHSDMTKDLAELLDEIQETIDEAENSEKGVHEVEKMKAEISAAVAAQPTGFGGDESGATTQIGFGSAASASGPTTSLGFGSSTATASTAAAQPVMVIKKKKKRDAEDAKMPAQENSAKQAKSE